MTDGKKSVCTSAIIDLISDHVTFHWQLQKIAAIFFFITIISAIQKDEFQHISFKFWLFDSQTAASINSLTEALSVCQY